MTQSAECCVAIVPVGTQVTQNTAWYELLLIACVFTYGWKRSEGGRRGEVSYVKKLFMENILLADFTNSYLPIINSKIFKCCMFESLNEWFKANRLSLAARYPFRRAPLSAKHRVTVYFLDSSQPIILRQTQSP